MKAKAEGLARQEREQMVLCMDAEDYPFGTTLYK